LAQQTEEEKRKERKKEREHLLIDPRHRYNRLCRKGEKGGKKGRAKATAEDVVISV